MALHRTRYTRVIAVEYDLVAQIINGAQHEKITRRRRRRRRAIPSLALMHAWDFSKIAIFRDVRNSAIIEKWPEFSAISPCPPKGTAMSPRARRTSC